MKYCPDCKTHQPRDQFYKKPSAKDGLGTYCKKHNKIRRKATQFKRELEIEDNFRVCRLTPDQISELLFTHQGICVKCKQAKELHPVSIQGAIQYLACWPCRKILLRKNIKYQCEQCDQWFERANWRIRESRKLNRRIFCGSSCSRKFFSQIRRENFVIPNKKTCSNCEMAKPLDDFYKIKTTLDGRVGTCKTCSNNFSKGWVEQNKSRIRERKYGLTPELETEFLESQGGVCAICRRKRKLVVDHDHVTGKIRGLLCYGCNTGLGKFGDNITGLEAAIAYLHTPTLRN